MAKPRANIWATRTYTELEHRLQAAWANFHGHKHVLTNRHVSVKLRLKIFNAIISPTTVWLASLPLTTSDYKRIETFLRVRGPTPCSKGHFGLQHLLLVPTLGPGFAVIWDPLENWVPIFFNAFPCPWSARKDGMTFCDNFVNTFMAMIFGFVILVNMTDVFP